MDEVTGLTNNNCGEFVRGPARENRENFIFRPRRGRTGGQKKFVLERTVASVSTCRHSTTANFKTFPCWKSTFWTPVRIRGGERMTILTSRGWRRSGSPSEAWWAWTRWRDEHAGWRQGLGLKLGDLIGEWRQQYPIFFKKVKFPMAKVIICKCVHFGQRP